MKSDIFFQQVKLEEECNEYQSLQLFVSKRSMVFNKTGRSENFTSYEIWVKKIWVINEDTEISH